MSSLAAARADNFYHPPEWDPQKISRDKYQGSKGANQYEQKGVIRRPQPLARRLHSLLVADSRCPSTCAAWGAKR